MNRKRFAPFFILLSLWAWVHGAAADMDVKLTTSDGSTKLSIQNSGAVEVSSIDSSGNANFNKVTQSSGTVNGSLTVTGILKTGSGTNQITTTTGLLDATKLAGNLPALNGSALTNLTAANVSGNIPGNAASITGTINTNQINAGSLASTVIASSITVGAVQDASIVSLSASKLTGMVSDTAIDSSSVTKQGNTFNMANSLVKLDGSGNMQIPGGASITIGSVRGSIVPSGTLILTTGACPSGFTEFTAAGGYYLVGMPSGGTVGGVVGTAMTDMANDPHNHTVTSTTATNTSTALGAQTRVTSVTSPTGDVLRGAIAPYFQVRLCSVP